MTTCEVKIGRGKWRILSAGHAWHMLGWMLVYRNCQWRTSEGDMRANDLVERLRGRQAKLDAPGILDQCEESSVQVWADCGNLRVRGPITDEMRSNLKRCKPALLVLLAEVPQWNDAEAADLQKRLDAGHKAITPHLHPTVDDVFSVAGRNVLADVLASIAKAVAAKRLDHLRRRIDFALGWMANLDKTLHELRPSYALNDRPLHLIHS